MRIIEWFGEPMLVVDVRYETWSDIDIFSKELDLNIKHQRSSEKRRNASHEVRE